MYVLSLCNLHFIFHGGLPEQQLSFGFDRLKICSQCWSHVFAMGCNILFCCERFERVVTVDNVLSDFLGTNAIRNY